MEIKQDEIDLNDFIAELTKLIDSRGEYTFKILFVNQTIVINQIALQQIFINLIVNGIKYYNKEQVEIAIGF
jgi:signal transduction histidine kinase